MGFQPFPARVGILSALATLLIGNALIIYQVTTPDADPSSGGLRQSADESVGQTISDIGEVLQGIRESIEARIERLEPIRIERSARQERPRYTVDQAQRSGESSVSSGPAPSESTSPGSSSATSGSMSDSTTESLSGGGTADAADSGDSGGGSQDATTAGSSGGGGGAGGGGGSVEGDAGSGGGTSGGGAGGGG